MSCQLCAPFELEEEQGGVFEQAGVQAGVFEQAGVQVGVSASCLLARRRCALMAPPSHAEPRWC